LQKYLLLRVERVLGRIWAWAGMIMGLGFMMPKVESGGIIEKHYEWTLWL